MTYPSDRHQELQDEIKQLKTGKKKKKRRLSLPKPLARTDKLLDKKRANNMAPSIRD